MTTIDSGVSPFLREFEVFDNPSRTARICEAFWAYKHKSVTDLPLALFLFLYNLMQLKPSFFRSSLLRPCLRDGVLAPTQNQRLNYGHWLHVYAKEMSAITPRMAGLVDLYAVRFNLVSLYICSSGNDVYYFSKILRC